MRKKDAENFEAIKIKMRKIIEMEAQHKEECALDTNYYTEDEFINMELISAINQEKREIIEILRGCI
jgi:predicted nucleotide-binding protein (sugar kinase/HSP70/actin superfamily)